MTLWLELTTAAAFGSAATAWPVIRHLGPRGFIRYTLLPTVALTVQALVLIGGSSLVWLGSSIAAGIAAGALSARFAGNDHEGS